MSSKFIEALDKAAQAAQMFSDDLADAYKRTETVAEEMVFMELLKQAKEISGKLGRLNKEAQEGVK